MKRYAITVYEPDRSIRYIKITNHILNLVNLQRIRGYIEEFSKKFIEKINIDKIDGITKNITINYAPRFQRFEKYKECLRKNFDKVGKISTEIIKLGNHLYKSITRLDELVSTVDVQTYDGKDFEAKIILKNIISIGRGPSEDFAKISSLGELVERMKWRIPSKNIVIEYLTPKEIERLGIKVYSKIPPSIFKGDTILPIIEIKGKKFLISEFAIFHLISNILKYKYKNLALIPSISYVGAFSFNKIYSKFAALVELYNYTLFYPNIMKIIETEYKKLTVFQNKILYFIFAFIINKIYFTFIYSPLVKVGVLDGHIDLGWAEWRAISEYVIQTIPEFNVNKIMRKVLEYLLIRRLEKKNYIEEGKKLNINLLYDSLRFAENLGIKFITNDNYYYKAYYSDSYPFIDPLFLRAIYETMKSRGISPPTFLKYF